LDLILFSSLLALLLAVDILISDSFLTVALAKNLFSGIGGTSSGCIVQNIASSDSNCFKVGSLLSSFLELFCSKL
jgi:hypothetical protein